MPSYVTPKKNTAFILYVSLVSQADTRLNQVNPTIASGDFKVSTDGGSLANLGTLPTVTPSGGAMVKISLSTGEMNGDNVTVVCSDAAGAEWCDLTVNIQTAARQIDDLAYPATTGRSMVVDASGLVDANAVKVGPSGSGTAQTARDVGASVLLSSGTGAGQLDFTSGIVKSNLTQVLGTALTETAGQIAAGFKKFFNIATPASTMDALTLVATATNLTNAPTSGDFTSAMKTSLNAATPAVTVSDKTGFSLSSGGVQAIWDALTSALTTAGSVGKLLVGMAASVWDVVLSGHTTSGTTGAGLNSASSAGDPWNTALPGSYGAGTAGKIIGDNIAATKSDTAAIKAKTDNLPASPASTTNITAGTITNVTNLTNAPTSGDLTATMKASVTTAATAATPALSTAGNAAVADKLLGRNLAGGSDSGRTVKDALRALRNKVDTVSVPGSVVVFAEDDTTEAWRATITTDGSASPVVTVDPT